MRRRFKETVFSLAEADERVVLLLGDVSVYMFQGFKEAFPARFYNLGILENTLISAGAGMAAVGLVPFIHTIAPFLTERSFEQIKLDMAYNGFGGNIVTCGASFDYAWDGATHHAYADLAMLRLLPGMEVIQPGSESELETLMRARWNSGTPTYFRLSDHPHGIDLPVRFGDGVLVREGSSDVAVVTAGPILANVLEACRDLDVSVAYFPTLKPMDHALLNRLSGHRILVVHDAHGLREAVGEVPGLRIWHHGLPDAFVGSYGTVHDARRRLGFDPAGIRSAVASLLDRRAA